MEEIKTNLKKEIVVGNNQKADMYTHLSEVFSRVMQYHPYDGYDKFEEISNSVK